MGFEAPVGLLRVLHAIAGPAFAVLATFFAPHRKRLALAWLGTLLILTGTAVWAIRPAVVEAGPGFALSVAMLFASPFAVALTVALSVAALLHWKAPSLPFLVRSGASLGGYIGALFAAQLLLPTIRLYSMLHYMSAG